MHFVPDGDGGAIFPGMDVQLAQSNHIKKKKIVVVAIKTRAYYNISACFYLKIQKRIKKNMMLAYR